MGGKREREREIEKLRERKRGRMIARYRIIKRGEKKQRK